MRAAAAFIRRVGDGSAGIRVPTSPMGVAVLAVKVSDVFLDSAHAALDAAGLGRTVVAAARSFDRASRG